MSLSDGEEVGLFVAALGFGMLGVVVLNVGRAAFGGSVDPALDVVLPLVVAVWAAVLLAVGREPVEGGVDE